MPKQIRTRKQEVGSKASGLDKKIEELTTDLQRVHADFVNYRRRSESEQAQVMKIAKQAVVAKLLPLIDNLERAANHLPKELRANTWAKGVAQTLKQTEKVLKELGVEKIVTRGQRFDPHLHEAVGLEDGQGDTEIVADEIQTGWKLDDQVIRPSLVRVRKIMP